MHDTSTRPPFIKVRQGVFFIDEDTSDELIQEYVTEFGCTTYIIKRNCTLRPPEYTLFHEYRQRHNGKMRTFRDHLYSSSKLDKIINYINEKL